MGGDHYPPPPKVPDWRIFKVQDCPELLNVQRMLAKQGLKDPWLRNEVWKYTPGTRSRYAYLKPLFFSGFKYGFAAFVLTVIGEKIYHSYYPDEHAHH